jgi:argininosuccinate lyase
MAYGKDMQEDKEPLFDTVKTIKLCLIVMNGMVSKLEPIPVKMLEALQRGFPTATDLADYLVTYLAIPFRDAHHFTGKIVLLAESKNCSLEKLTLDDIRTIVPNADQNILNVLKIENSVSQRTSYGGTAPKNVLKAVKKAKLKFLGNKNEI